MLAKDEFISLAIIMRLVQIASDLFAVNNLKQIEISLNMSNTFGIPQKYSLSI